MAMPTPHRRAFSQIQNTISQSKTTSTKTVAAAAKENHGASKKTKKQGSADKQLQASVALKDKVNVAQSVQVNQNDPGDTKGKNSEIVQEQSRQSFDGIDFDAPIETCPHVDFSPMNFDLDTALPEEERLSLLGPRFWNRVLMPPLSSFPFDADNKENIFEELYANLDDDPCDLGKLEPDSDDGGFQKLSLRK